MKKILPIAALLIVCTGLLSSCQKEVQERIMVKEIIIDTTIVSGNDYLLDLSNYGTEGDYARILEKGNNASVSQLENETDMFTTINKPGSKDSTTVYVNISVK